VNRNWVLWILYVSVSSELLNTRDPVGAEPDIGCSTVLGGGVGLRLRGESDAIEEPASDSANGDSG
jgi:hypothetical protein